MVDVASGVGATKALSHVKRWNGIPFFEKLTDNHPFKWFIFICIFVNSAMIGYDANYGPANPYHVLIEHWNQYFLYIYTAELIMELLAVGPARYVRVGWNLFDCVIVVAGYLAVVPGITAVRSLRVLRVFRLISNVPAMRHVVEALMHAMAGVIATVMVLAVVFFIGAVMSTTLFHTEPGFQSLGAATMTLIQLAVFDNWGDTIRSVDLHYPYAWAFLVPFTVIAAFAVLNLFIGVIVDAVQHTRLTLTEEIEKDVTEIEKDVDAISKDVSDIEAGVSDIAEAQEDAATMQKHILTEMRALRAELAAMKAAQVQSK